MTVAMAVSARDREAVLARALREQGAGRFAAARAACAEILAEEPDEPTTLYVAALADIARGARRTAREELTRLVAVRPNVAEGRIALARLLSLEAEHPAALVQYERAAALKPNDVEPALALVEGLLAAGRADEATRRCHEALGRIAGSAALLEALGTAELAAGNATRAVATLRRALGIAPKATTRLGLARALLAAAQAREALSTLTPLLFGAEDGAEAGVEATPITAEAAFLAGNARKALLDYPAAIAAFERAIALAPGDAHARLNLGNCLAALGRFAEAERTLRAALGIDSALVEAKESLCSVLLLAGRIRESEMLAREILARDPDRVVSHQNLAAILAADGREEEAARHREAAYRRQSVFVEAAGDNEITVLMPTAAEGGNVPTKFLFPRDRCALIKWFIGYAGPSDGATLPAYDVVFNGIGDPDFADATRAPLARFLGGCTRPVLNRQERVAATRRDLIPGLLAAIPDLVIPPIARLTLPVAPVEEFARRLAASGITFPALLRPVGSHGGASVRLVPRLGDLADLAAHARGAIYVSSFAPYRSEDGYFRKYRMIFVDRRAFPYHLALSRSWLVHYVSADMLANATKCDEEKRFLQDPDGAIGTRAMTAAREIGKRLDLDFAGMDFSILPDGRLLLFEANATMLVHPEDESGSFAYKNRAVREILDAFDATVAARLDARPEGRGAGAA